MSNIFEFKIKMKKYFITPRSMDELAKHLFSGDCFIANNFQNWAQINGYLTMDNSHQFINKK